MLTIRREQMHLLAAPSFERFAQRGLVIVKTHFGTQFTVLGEVAVREAVLHATAQAASYGFLSDEDALVWLVLMFTFGRDFDRLPWAAGALQAHGHDAAFRMSRLQSLARAYDGAGAGYCSTGV